MGLFNKLFGNKDKDLMKVKLSLVDYNQYFDNTKIDNTPLEFLDLGELNLTTGKIIACDPLVFLYKQAIKSIFNSCNLQILRKPLRETDYLSAY